MTDFERRCGDHAGMSSVMQTSLRAARYFARVGAVMPTSSPPMSARMVVFGAWVDMLRDSERMIDSIQPLFLLTPSIRISASSIAWQ